MQKEKKQKYQEMISIEEYLMKRRKQKEIEDRQFRQEERGCRQIDSSK